MLKNPIFVVGAPRTGTTLVRNILNNNPDVYIFDESHFLTSIWGNRKTIGHLDTEESLNKAINLTLNLCKLYNKVEEDILVNEIFSRASLTKKVVEQGPSYANLLKIFLSELALSKGKQFWGDSDPVAVFYMPLLKSWYPDCKFIGLIRDPRAYAASAKNSWKLHPGPQEQREYSKRHYHPLLMSINYRMCMNAILKAKKGNLADDLYLIKYEDLVSQPKEQIRKLCRFLNIDFVGKMLEVKKANSSFRDMRDKAESAGISDASIDKWRNELSSSEIFIVQANCRKFFVEFGYAMEKTPFKPFELFKETLKLPRAFLTIFSQSSNKRGSLLSYLGRRISNLFSFE